MPVRYQNDVVWKRKLQQFEVQNPFHHILINGEEVFLLTIGSGDESHEGNTTMERINKAISEARLRHDSEMNGEDERHESILKCSKPNLRYFSIYMTNELQNIYDIWESYNPMVTFLEDSLLLSSSSLDITNKITSQLKKSLSRITNVKKQFQFPGLPTYLNSSGLNLIQNLSDQYKCLIEVPDPGNTSSPHLSLNEEQTSEVTQGLVYKVIFLGTASCRGFNIHLVQGDISDLKLEMKIQLQPTEKGKDNH